MGRHRRSAQLAPLEIEKLSTSLTDCHRDLRSLMAAVRIDSDHYRGLAGLSDAINRAFKEITGDVAPWRRVVPSETQGGLPKVAGAADRAGCASKFVERPESD